MSTRIPLIERATNFLFPVLSRDNRAAHAFVAQGPAQDHKTDPSVESVEPWMAPLRSFESAFFVQSTQPNQEGEVSEEVVYRAVDRSGPRPL
jgi:hypothetical protein